MPLLDIEHSQSVDLYYLNCECLRRFETYAITSNHREGYAICMIPFRPALYATLTLAFVIAAGTLTPLPERIDVPGTDKWQHLVAFAALTFPLSATKPSKWMFIAPLALMFGALIEVIQPFVNRYGDLADFQADAIGVSIGVLLGATANLIKRIINAR